MTFFKALKRAISDFSEDECMSSGAAIAYYAIFSMPPLLVLVFLVAGWLGVSRQKIDQVVKDQLGMPMESAGAQADAGSNQPTTSGSPASGDGSTSELTGVAERTSASQLGGVGLTSRIIGAALLVFSATGLFAQMQFALNRAWEVEPDPDQGGVWRFIFKRVLSFGMIVTVAFLLLISLVLTTLIDEITTYLQGNSPSTFTQVLGVILNNVAIFAIAMLLFAAMYKILPDANMSWKDTWIGAALTAVLFVIGKSLIAWYLQSSDVGTSWGSAAASMVGVLVWIYYSSLIVLFGAELTQVWASQYGSGIEPASGAVRKVEEKRHVRGTGQKRARGAGA